MRTTPCILLLSWGRKSRGERGLRMTARFGGDTIGIAAEGTTGQDDEAGDDEQQAPQGVWAEGAGPAKAGRSRGVGCGH